MRLFCNVLFRLFFCQAVSKRPAYNVDILFQQHRLPPQPYPSLSCHSTGKWSSPYSFAQISFILYSAFFNTPDSNLIVSIALHSQHFTLIVPLIGSTWYSSCSPHRGQCTYLKGNILPFLSAFIIHPTI